jgi:hypothetical protein
MSHLAGIIPLANLQTDMTLPFPASLLPVDDGFTAIQKSVYECSLAGCKTIWIVANQDMAPAIKKVVGEWVYDPVYYHRISYGEGSENRREIPIYYVPINPKNIDRRDSYGWSILSGIYSSWRVANQISKWVVPKKYFISFPMSLYDVELLRKYRKDISHSSKNFSLEWQNKTIRDGLPLPFTMFGDDYINCRRDVNNKTTKEYLAPPPGEQYPTEKLPLDERWSAKSFNLKEIFDKLNLDEDNRLPVDWFVDCRDWKSYTEYLNNYNIKKPHDVLTKTHIHANIPYKA